MSFSQFEPRTAVLVLMIVIVSTLRVVFNFNYDVLPLANFSPIGAVALFGGAYFNKVGKAFVFPLITLFISDVILSQTAFKLYGGGILYSGWYWVYSAFALMTLTGRWLMKKVAIHNFLLSVFTCVFIHWIVTDIGVWLGSKVYAQNFNGFMECLLMAVPFEWRFLAGTLVYGCILFGAFEYMKNRFAVLRLQHV